MPDAQEIIARRIQAAQERLDGIQEEIKIEEAEEELEDRPTAVGDIVHFEMDWSPLYVSNVIEHKERGRLVDVDYFDNHGVLHRHYNIPDILLHFWSNEAEEKHAEEVERKDL
jgi:hypothetical protein